LSSPFRDATLHNQGQEQTSNKEKEKDRLVERYVKKVTSLSRLAPAVRAEPFTLLPQTVYGYDYSSSHHYSTCINVIRQF